MRQFVDLHTHSTASDGSLAPAKLIAAAERRRLAAIALTDHDTFDGLAEAQHAAERFPNLTFVPGVEVSARPPSGTLHILGLGIDPASRPVQELAEFLRHSRDERNPRIVARLQALGLAIDMDDVLAAAERAGSARKIISRAHIGQALLDKKLVRNRQEGFDRYLKRGAAAYVDRRRHTPRQTLRAIRDAGGIAALAHPVQLACDNLAQLERILRQLMDCGLEAIEVYHSDHTPLQTGRYIRLAKKLGLAVTGGSDFHGGIKAHAKLGHPRVPLAALDSALAERLLGHP